MCGAVQDSWCAINRDTGLFTSFCFLGLWLLGPRLPLALFVLLRTLSMDGPPDHDEKAGSAESENGSDNSYVQVSREDAQDSPVPPQTDSPQLVSGSGMSPDEELDTTVYEDTQQEPVEVCN